MRENHRDEIDRGRKYDIDIPFAHFKYERILDTGAAATKTDIQWGYSAGGDFETDTSVTPNIGDYDSVLTAPLIFYGIQETTSNAIAFLPSGANAESITQYFRPSNTNEAGSTTTAPSFSLNFDGETDEWWQVDMALIQQ